MKEAGVLLITTVMLLSTLAVAENTSIYSQSIDIGKSEPVVGTPGDILLEEGFEDGVMPPDGWTLINTQDPPYTWHIVDTTDTDVGVHSGNYAAAVKRYHISGQDERLISPELDFSGYDEVTLKFWAASWTWNPDATVKVLVEYDDTEDVIWDMIEDETWETVEYREVELDLSTYVDVTFTICFQYIGIQGWHFGLDDISFYAIPTELPDLKIGDIKGGFSKISAEIKNVGEGDANDINWSIGIYGFFRPILGEWNGTIPNLPAGETEVISTDGIILGFGKVDIEVNASEPHYGSSDTRTVNGFIFICYIFIIGS